MTSRFEEREELEHKRDLEIAKHVGVWNNPKGGGSKATVEISYIGFKAGICLVISTVIYCATLIYLKQ